MRRQEMIKKLSRKFGCSALTPYEITKDFLKFHSRSGIANK